MLGHQDDGGVVNSCSVLNAVDANGHQLTCCLLTEHVGGHPAAQLVRARDGRFCHLYWPQRREITDVSVDPIPDKLHPAVSAGGLALHLGDQLTGLDFFAVVAEIALRPSNVTASTDDLREI